MATVLLAVALLAGLFAALIMLIEIRAARAARDRATARADNPPRANALDLGQGIVNRPASEAFRLAESQFHREEVTERTATITRQSWAFVALVVAAMCGFAAGLLSVWA